MSITVKTIRLCLVTDKHTNVLFSELTKEYAKVCNFISEYVFKHNFLLSFMKLQEKIYYCLRDQFLLKSQMTISALKTVTARYKAVKEQLYGHPYKYQDENKTWQYITKTLEWLQKPIYFKRSQADFVRNRDYSFVDDGTNLSLNTLGKRVKVSFHVPEYFEKYFDGTWDFGTGKLVKLKGHWYFHIPLTKVNSLQFDRKTPSHVVGIDRGLHFLTTTYDEKGITTFISGKKILKKRDSFNKVRAELQAKGTKSAKRVLRRISGRENRFMSDVNHQISKALVDKYGENTLFVLEDLRGISFAEENLSNHNRAKKRELRSWTFYQLEQFLSYKAEEIGSKVIKVSAEYTSQRCPKCGRIHKLNRHHEIHEYICDTCGYRSNDDRVGAMNIQTLGALYVSGDANPRFGARKVN